MINKLFILLFCLFMTICLSVSALAEDKVLNQLTILSENAGESNHIGKNGKMEGHNVEIVQEIMKRLGISCEIEAVPWARGYFMALNDPNTMLFTTTRIPEREKLFKWAGPLHVSRYVFYARKDYPREIKSIDDARNVTAIGCTAEDVRHKILINKGFKNLDPYFGMNANTQNLKKLLAGRIDLWISSPKDSIETARKLGVDYNRDQGSHDTFNIFQLYGFLFADPGRNHRKVAENLR